MGWLGARVYGLQREENTCQILEEDGTIYIMKSDTAHDLRSS